MNAEEKMNQAQISSQIRVDVQGGELQLDFACCYYTNNSVCK